MRTFFAILTAALVSLHALLGCCWHHGHSCAVGHDEHASVGFVEHCGSEHSNASHEHESPHRDACQESPCVFTTVDGPTFDAGLHMTLWQPICIDDSASIGAFCQSTFDWALDRSPAATIPIRLHLFKGLLLI